MNMLEMVASNIRYNRHTHTHTHTHTYTHTHTPDKRCGSFNLQLQNCHKRFQNEKMKRKMLEVLLIKKYRPSSNKQENSVLFLLFS